MIARAARSLTEPPGFMNSALPRIVQPVASEARLSLISGVLPMASTTDGVNFMKVLASEKLGDGARGDKLPALKHKSDADDDQDAGERWSQPHLRQTRRGVASDDDAGDRARQQKTER